MTTVTTAGPDVFERRESEARSYCRSFPTTFKSATNATLTDVDGRSYIDFLAGCSSLNYGHNDPDMKAALIDYIASDGVTHGLDMQTEAKAAFIETFERLILEPRGMDHKIMFTGPTGTNAVEAAMKLARKVTGRADDHRLHQRLSRHDDGRAQPQQAMSRNATAPAARRSAILRGCRMRALSALTPIRWRRSRSCSTTRRAAIDAPAAFIVEPVQGEGGLNAASKEWMQGIARLARKHGALLIVDEIQAGIGRTGGFFSFDEFGIEPDLIPLAKSLSGMGLPLAVLLIKPEHDIWKPAEHNGTFRGNNHAFVTARVALEKFWSDGKFAGSVREKADYLEQRLDAMRMQVSGSRLKGRGMMRGIDVGSGDLAATICAECFRNGLIIETSGAEDEVVKVLAPLTIPPEQFAAGLDILENAIAAAVSPNRIAAE